MGSIGITASDSPQLGAVGFVSQLCIKALFSIANSKDSQVGDASVDVNAILPRRTQRTF